MDVENFIVGQHRKYLQARTDELNWEYLDLYDAVSQKQLRELLAAIHADLVMLFEMMNRRLPTGDDGAHFWADESRSLIFAIEIVTTLRSQLEGTQYSFEIDSYYARIFDEHSKWLSASGGSTIPPHTAAVNIYYIKPMFNASAGLQVHELYVIGERLERLGSGGFGEVYRYRHPYIDMDFAVKVFSPMFASDEDEEEGEKRFFREAKMLFLLNHPNIVRIYDVGRIEGRPYMKMELIDGMNMNEFRVRYHSIPFANAGRAIS